ncbi:MAG: lamin tail domain-containing protein, partial [Oligoflexia bacterium]|nr:lamin tail domain-containing protein [Oligoflexia bacterium]
MLLVLLGLRSALAGDVVLNELLYDPASSGGDSGAEWIELCNPTSRPIDLAGWSVEAGGSSFSNIFDFPALSISPGEHLLIGAGSTYTLSGTMQNGGSATDGVRLLDDLGAVVDTVLYDSPNTNSLVDDSGGVGVEFAIDVAEGHTLARLPDCTDSDDNSLDFVESSSPTPGAENVADGGTDTGTGGTADCSAMDQIRLNEIMVDPDSKGGDSGYEWVELVNSGGTSADLSGWQLVARKSDTTSSTVTLDSDTSVAAGDFLVLGETEVPEADIVVSLDLGNDSTSIDTVELWCGSTTVDLMAYGGTNDLGWTNEDGVLDTLAPKPAQGWSLGRDPDGADSNDCAVDLVAFEYPSPGASNATSGEGDCPGMDDIKLNEFIPNPAKPEGAKEEDPEWVELYNVGVDTVSLDGWSLQYGTSPSNTKTIDISALSSIDPGQYLVVGEKGAENVDLVVSMDMGAASSNSDRLQLKHCGPGTADTVVYGSPNDDEWTDDSGEIATSLAVKPSDGDTLQRVQDGYDTDECAVDWTISATPTPGSANTLIEP